jgi:RNA polymerase sigma-70 factor, ECF subfamily
MGCEQIVEKNPSADIQDINRVLQGDEQAYANIVRRHETGIARQMWRFTRNHATLEELVHEVFVEAFVSLHSYRGKAPFEHWLRRIATRIGYRYWKHIARDRERQSVLALLGESAFQPEKLLPSEAAEYAYRILETLPAKDRLVLTLLYLEEWNTREIAECMGWSQTLVKVRAFRARKKIRTQLEAAGYGSKIP